MCVVGTNAEDANTSGNTQMKPSDCAVSGLRALIPTNALIHENTYAKPSTSANARMISGTEPLGRKPTAKPMTSMTSNVTKFVSKIGGGPADEYRGLRDRQRPEPVDDAGGEVLGEAETGRQRAEHGGHDDDPGQQVVDVADVSRVDRAAEHVAEQQHEEHGLHEQIDDEHRPAENLAQL